MKAWWGEDLWRQFGAAIDLLEKAIRACPDELWTQRVWPNEPPDYFPRQFAEFWYVSHHALVWLDLYLSGLPEAEFTPPAPFEQGELDSHAALPDRPYGKELLLPYLGELRRRCRATLGNLAEEGARRPITYPWTDGQQVSYFELLIYTLRHVQEHAAQLNLFLGQHGVPDDAIDAVARARD